MQQAAIENSVKLLQSSEAQFHSYKSQTLAAISKARQDYNFSPSLPAHLLPAFFTSAVTISKLSALLSKSRFSVKAKSNVSSGNHSLASSLCTSTRTLYRPRILQRRDASSTLEQSSNVNSSLSQLEAQSSRLREGRDQSGGRLNIKHRGSYLGSEVGGSLAGTSQISDTGYVRMISLTGNCVRYN